MKPRALPLLPQPKQLQRLPSFEHLWLPLARDYRLQVLKQLDSGKVISTAPKNFNSELGVVFSIFEITEYTPNI